MNKETHEGEGKRIFISKAGETPTETMTYNVVIGFESYADGFRNCVVIGHHLKATRDNQILIAGVDVGIDDVDSALQIKKGLVKLLSSLGVSAPPKLSE